MLLESDGELRDWSRALEPGEEAVVDSFFVEYIKSQACLADELRLDPSAVGSIDDVSGVKMALNGSLTRANTTQTLVVFFAGHCGVLGGHSESYGVTFDLLFERGRLIASSREGPAGVQIQPIDLDRDGLTELVELSADYASGTTFSQAAIWSYRDGTPKVLASIELSHNSCNVPGEHYEATLFTRWEPSRSALCFLAKRRDIGCSP